MESDDFIEKRKYSYEGFEMEIDNKDLKIFALQMENSMKDITNKMLKKEDIEIITKSLIDSHEKTCPLAAKNILTTDNCYVEWKICHAKHQEESAQLTTARLGRFKEYREFFVWAAFGGYVIFQALDWNKLFELVK